MFSSVCAAPMPRETGRTAGGRISHAVAEESVEAHRGTLQAASAGLGMGCTFTMNSPLEPHTPETPKNPDPLDWRVCQTVSPTSVPQGLPVNWANDHIDMDALS